MRWNIILTAIILSSALAWAAPDGKVLYSKWCASCHGEKGLGDGPQAAVFDSKPASLASATYKRGNSDKAVLKVITKGVPGTPMDGFGDKLDEAERQSLVTYLKQLRGEK